MKIVLLGLIVVAFTTVIAAAPSDNDKNEGEKRMLLSKSESLKLFNQNVCPLSVGLSIRRSQKFSLLFSCKTFKDLLLKTCCMKSHYPF